MDREEAIRRIKAWNLDSDDMEVLAVVIPELAESDDERIREEMVRYFTEMKKGGSAALPYDDCIAYLEKQKDLDKMIVVSPEVWDKAISDAFENGKKEGKKQKEQKSKWSEEDEEILNELLNHCNTENATWYNWLKSLRPQPKQVWTEEDDRICHLIMANLSESVRHAITLPMETVNDFNNWLRTLQCMPPVFTDWNEEDQTLLSDALGCVTMVQELKKRGKLKNFHISCSYDELRSWVRSLKSRPRKQPSWKPSEEQMEAFKDYIEDFQAKAEAAVGGWNNFDVMIELYEQLKKL